MEYLLIKTDDLIYYTNDSNLRTIEKTGLDCIWYYTLGKCFLNVRHSNIPLGSITFKDELYCIESVGYNTTCDTLKAAQEKLINYVTTGIKT